MANQVKVEVISRTFEEVHTEFKLNKKMRGLHTLGLCIKTVEDHTLGSQTKINIFELTHIWKGWDKAKKTQFTAKYGHIVTLLKILINRQLV